jgi:hypothetical protein
MLCDSELNSLKMKITILWHFEEDLDVKFGDDSDDSLKSEL